MTALNQRRRVTIIKRADFAHCPPVDHTAEVRAALAPIWRWHDRVMTATVGLGGAFVALRLLT